MNKRLLAMLVCAFALCLSMAALAGCSSGGSDSADSGEAADTAATDATAAEQLVPEEGMDFIVGFDQDYPPYGFIGDDGEYTGFDLDLAAEVCKRNGWNFVAQPINWDAKDGELNGGAITCIWNGFTQEGREADYTFSDPYMLNAQVVVVKADSDIASLDDLAGKTVVTQVDSAALEVLEGDQADLAATFGSLDTRAEYNTAFLELESGAVDAVACDLSIAQFQMAGNPDKYVMLDDYLSEEHYAVGFKLGNTQMAEAVQATLEEMDADGTVKELCEKYADYGISYENWVLE
jgi:polar amino acid transport system substrate-binding protein